MSNKRVKRAKPYKKANLQRKKTVRRIVSTVLSLVIVLVSVSFATGVKFRNKLSQVVPAFATANTSLPSTSSDPLSVVSDFKHFDYQTLDTPKTFATDIKAINNKYSALYTFPDLSTLTPIAPVDGKVVYLTFDDGPSSNTPKLIKILADNDVKGTFFEVHTGYTKYMKSIVDSGNTIGLHSETHDYKKIYSSDEAYFLDLEQIRQTVLDHTGVNSNIVRLPGGASNTVSEKYNKGIMTRITQKLTESGYIYVDWSVDSGDADVVKPTKDYIINNVVKSFHNQKHIDLLMHDANDKGGTVEALPYIIQFYKSKGYSFSVIDASAPTDHQKVAN